MDFSNEKRWKSHFFRSSKSTLKMAVFELFFKKWKFSTFLKKIGFVCFGKVCTKRKLGIYPKNAFLVVIEPLHGWKCANDSGFGWPHVFFKLKLVFWIFVKKRAHFFSMKDLIFVFPLSLILLYMLWKFSWDEFEVYRLDRE